MTKEYKAPIHQVVVLVLWAFTVAVFGLMIAYLITNLSLKPSASTATPVAVPDESFSVLAGETKTINGVGSIRVKCNTTVLAPASFSAYVKLDKGYRGGVNNSSSPTRGTSATVSGLSRSGFPVTYTLAPGKATGYLYPGTQTSGLGSMSVTYPATSSSNTFTNCDVLIKGYGNATVTAGTSPITIDVFYQETTAPIATADDPIPLLTTINSESCSNNLTVKGQGTGPTGNETNQVADTIDIPATNKVGTIYGYNTYNVTVTDSVTGVSKSVRIDKNKDTKLNVAKKCDGTLTIEQPARITIK